jgi:hypothetical protein
MKKLLSSLAIATLLFTACKKNDGISPSEGQNQRDLVLTTPDANPIAVIDPTVFFFEQGDVLYSINNIAAPTPTVNYKGPILGDIKNNPFNKALFLSQRPIYSPFTDQILASTGGKTLYKCFTPTRLTTQFLSPNYIVPIKVNPADKKLYYYAPLFDGVDPTKKGELRSVNLDGTNDVLLRSFSANDLIPNAASCDIDFNSKFLYLTNANLLYKTSINSNLQSPFFILVPPGEDLYQSVIKVDQVHKTIFFSSTNESTMRKKIWRIDASGDASTLKLVVRTDYTDPLTTFSFDISPKTNTIFWCKRELTPEGHRSVVTRANMDGTGAKIVRNGRYINTVVVAEPQPIK